MKLPYIGFAFKLFKLSSSLYCYCTNLNYIHVIINYTLISNVTLDEIGDILGHVITNIKPEQTFEKHDAIKPRLVVLPRSLHACLSSRWRKIFESISLHKGLRKAGQILTKQWNS